MGTILVHRDGEPNGFSEAGLQAGDAGPFSRVVSLSEEIHLTDPGALLTIVS